MLPGSEVVEGLKLVDHPDDIRLLFYQVMDLDLGEEANGDGLNC